MNYLLGYLAVLIQAILALGGSFAWAKSSDERVELCPQIILHGKLNPNLGETEKDLVCGRPPESASGAGEAWKKIPLSQAQFHLRTFLQERGYHHPRIVWQESRLEVFLGETTRVESVEIEGAPESLRFDRKRKVIGEILTPKLLSAVEQWVIQRLQAEGYPCPTVKSEAFTDAGIIRLAIKTGPLQNLTSIIEEPIEGLRSGVLRRYDAFQMGERFQGDGLGLTENRINGLDVVQSVHLFGTCGETGATIRQSTVPGFPRLIRIGFGANTEGLLLVRSSWRNTRLGELASWFDLTGLASAKEQRIQATFNWYHLPFPSRRVIVPYVEVRHRNETYFESLSNRTDLSYRTTWDGADLGLGFQLGPSLYLVRTFRGVGPKDAHFLFMHGEARVKSHDFEFFATNPRSGYSASAVVDLNHPNLFSTATAEKVALNWEGLWNWRGYDPALWVFGVRGSFSTIFNPDGGLTGDSGLPPDFLNFLGGSANLRGFGRQELPTDGVGRFSLFYAGLEVRLANELPFKLDPFVFLDWGLLGQDPLSLDAPVYWSPGLGMRWASPIGVVRTTVAKGFAGGESQHWQLFFSFGEEF